MCIIVDSEDPRSCKESQGSSGNKSVSQMAVASDELASGEESTSKNSSKGDSTMGLWVPETELRSEIGHAH